MQAEKDDKQRVWMFDAVEQGIEIDLSVRRKFTIMA